MAAQAARIGGPPGRRIDAARRLGGRGRRRENADGQGPVGRSPTAVRGPQQDAVEADGAGPTGDRKRVLVGGRSEKRSVGKEGVRQCDIRWAAGNKKKKK